MELNVYNDYLRSSFKAMNGERSIGGKIRDYHKMCSDNSSNLEYLFNSLIKRGYAVFFEGYDLLRGFINHLHNINLLPNLRINKEEILLKLRNSGEQSGYIYIGDMREQNDVMVCLIPSKYRDLESFTTNAFYWFGRQKENNGEYSIRFDFDGCGFKCTRVINKLGMNKDLKQLEFPEQRYRHCYAVGRKMYDYARNILNRPENYCRDLFVLGNIHDIGYEFESTLNGHGHCLAEALKSSYKYSFALEAHSMEPFESAKEELVLLYWADATTKGDGTYCTYAERIEDLSKRYGPSSKEVLLQKQIVDFLKRRGFKD